MFPYLVALVIYINNINKMNQVKIYDFMFIHLIDDL